MERHWANGKRSVSEAAESLALPNRYVVWCADRSFCRFHLAYGSDEQNLRRRTLLHENFLCHRAFCDSDGSWLQPFVVHLRPYTARKDAYQRTIVPNRLGENPESDESLRRVFR